MNAKTGFAIGLIILLFGITIFYYYQIKPDNHEDVLGAEYESLLAVDEEDLPNPTEIYVPLEIYSKIVDYNISDFFPESINDQKIINIYPEKSYLVYPFETDIYIEPEDMNYSSIETEYHFQAFYVTFDPGNSKDELPINIHVMKVKDNINNQDVLDTMDYLYRYPNDIYGNFNMKGENAEVWGAYMPEVYARGAPLDYAYKHISYRIYFPRDRILVELNTAYKNYKEEGHEVLKEYLSYLVNAKELESINEDFVLKDVEEYKNYTNYGDQFITRLKKIDRQE